MIIDPLAPHPFTETDEAMPCEVCGFLKMVGNHVCDTCADALDVTSILTLADHVCEYAACPCRCPKPDPLPFTCRYCGARYAGTLLRHLIDSPDPKHNA